MMIRRVYLAVRNEIMSRGGLQPRGVYEWTADGAALNVADAPVVRLPNLVGWYNPPLVACIQRFGLGRDCLLVSENKRVSEAMAAIYPATHFASADLFPELMDAEGRPDFRWDVCREPPPDLRAMAFDSIVCHALLEHVIDPTAALKNMGSLLNPGGHLFFMTHTPSFHKHSYPRDYVRFHHDYFEDLPQHLSYWSLNIELRALHSAGGTICGAYQRGSNGSV